MDHRKAENYRFDEYTQQVGGNWFENDPLLAAWLKQNGVYESGAPWLCKYGEIFGGSHREIADFVEQRENLPYLTSRDPYNQNSWDAMSSLRS